VKGSKPANNEEVICTANGWLEDQDQQFLYNGIRVCKKRWTKCISVPRDYVKKWQNMIYISFG